MTVRCELKKLLLKQYGLWLIAAALIVKIIALTAGSDMAVLNMAMEDHRADVCAYLQTLSGALTDEKRRYIEAEAAALAAAERDFQQTEQQFLAGECTEYDFLQAAEKYNAAREKREAFSVIQGQFLAAQEDANRYFLYANGWSVLLAGNHADWILIVLICLLCAPLVCNEYAAEMADLLAVTKNGKRRLYCSKLFAMLIAATAVTCVFCLADGVSAWLKYGLPHGEYPLQSVPQFADSAYGISCVQAAFLISLCKVLGACLLAVILFLAAVLLKRAVPAMLTGLSAVYLPMLLLPRSQMQFLLPLPCGMLHAYRFLQGSFPVGVYGNQTEITLTQADFSRTVCIIAAILAVTVLCLSVRIKRIAALAVFGCMLLSGCGNPQFYADRAYNSHDPFFADANANYTAELHDGEPVLRTADGDEIPLRRDPFSDTATVDCIALFADEHAVYRLESVRGISANGLSLHIEQIIRTGLSDFSETVIYRNEILADPSTAFLGLGAYLPYPKADDAAQIRRFAVFGGDMLIETQNGLWRIPTGKTDGDKLADGEILSWCCHAECVYYVDKTYRLHRVNVNTKADGVICGEPVSEVRFSDGCIFAKSVLRWDTVLTKRPEDAQWRTGSMPPSALRCTPPFPPPSAKKISSAVSMRISAKAKKQLFQITEELLLLICDCASERRFANQHFKI